MNLYKSRAVFAESLPRRSSREKPGERRRVPGECPGTSLINDYGQVAAIMRTDCTSSVRAFLIAAEPLAVAPGAAAVEPGVAAVVPGVAPYLIVNS